jgi:hypothetical protein
MRGGSQPALIRCSDGKLYVVKFFNNKQGPNVLANEVLGNEFFLHAFNLPTPQWKPILISKSFLKSNAALSFDGPYRANLLQSGLHFDSEFLGSVKVGAVYDWLPTAFSNRVTNTQDFVGIQIFDVWMNHL